MAVKLDAPLFGGEKYKVIIAGAGLIGSKLAQLFHGVSHAIQLTVIDQREYFENHTGIMRCAADPSFLQQTSIPHHAWLAEPFKSLVVGHLVEVRERTVVVDTAGVLKELQFNALIVCTGTNYPHFKEDAHQTLEQRSVFYFDCNEKIRKSDNICIVGGGASGCELAGEIRNCFPEKNITLVHSKERVLPQSPIGISELMLEKLVDSKIEVILEDHIDVDFDYQLHDHEAELEEGEQVIPSALFFKRRTVCTRKGRKIHTDLVIPCLQGTPNTEALRRYFSAHLTESGHVDVRNTMQLPSSDNIFVCGDIVNREHCDLYINVKEHVDVVFKNVCDVVIGKHAYITLPSHAPFEYPEIICFGPQYGIAASKGCCGFFKGVASGNSAWAATKRLDLVERPGRMLADI